MGNNITKAYKQAFFIGTITFFLAIIIAFTSDLFLKKSSSLIISFLFLILIISIGILFDMIGTAATAANEEPCHAKAAKKIKGAKQAYTLIKNADKVASFCNDVIGDISGTVSGALGAAIVFQLITTSSSLNEAVLSMIMTGFVAAATVGGKAFGKKMAIDKSDTIMLKVGYLLAIFEEISGKRSRRKKTHKKKMQSKCKNKKSQTDKMIEQAEGKREKVGKS